MSSMRDIVLSLCCVLFLAILIDGGGFDPYCKITLCQPKGRSGEPLFLTPYILSGQWKQGQKIAQVPPLLDDINSYSGYLTVNQQYKSNMFFWYFPAENNSSEAPVALWLQGGPGSSSMFSLFLETGPFIINADLSLRRRPNSWTQNINMLYIDNPVGTGFSFTKDDRGYATNEEDVGRDLYAALVQFFLLFPDLQDNEFFLTGESYAGKYIPALARSIHMNNPSGVVKINLQGMAIGNGFIDPENMMKYGDYLFQHGLVDRFGLAVYHNIEDKIRDDIKNERFAEAGRAFGSIFMISAKLLGDVDVYNYLLDTETQLSGARIVQLFCQPQVRKRIHVGNLTYNDGKVVQKYLEIDMAKSVKPWFQELIEYYRVLLYNGQLDIIVAYPLTVNFIENLEWSGAEEYKLTHRKEWYVRNNLAGYSKTVKNFTELLIRDAGHMVPSDQPEYALDMIERFVKNQPF